MTHDVTELSASSAWTAPTGIMKKRSSATKAAHKPTLRMLRSHPRNLHAQHGVWAVEVRACARECTHCVCPTATD